MIRPDVVWFGEMLPQDIWTEALQAAEECEVFFSVGTSAVVYPAAMLPFTAKRANALLIEINPQKTPLSELADHYLEGKSGEILPKLLDAMGL
jgi:NAD-dependent deacetylase